MKQSKNIKAVIDQTQGPASPVPLSLRGPRDAFGSTQAHKRCASHCHFLTSGILFILTASPKTPDNTQA